MEYAHTTTTTLPFAEAVERVRQLLGEQGFGILSEIDVHATLTAKLGADVADTVGEYVILGACNPTLARRALTAEPQIGVLLPCNVVVRHASGETATTVQAIDPNTMAELSGSPDIAAVATDADSRLRAALAGLPPAN